MHPNIPCPNSLPVSRLCACLAYCVLGLAAAHFANAQSVEIIPATDIGAACLDEKSQVSTEICYAFVLGVVQTHQSMSERFAAEAQFCLPEDLTRARALSALRKRFRRHLEHSSVRAEQFVIQALQASFPCP